MARWGSGGANLQRNAASAEHRSGGRPGLLCWTVHIPTRARPFLLACTCTYWAFCLVCSFHLSQPSHFLSAFKPQFKSQLLTYLHPHPGDFLQTPRTFHSSVIASTLCACKLVIHPAASLKRWLPQGQGLYFINLYSKAMEICV